MIHTLNQRCEICNGVRAHQKKSRKKKNTWFMCSECMNSTPLNEHRCDAITTYNKRCKRWTIGRGHTRCSMHEVKK